MRISWLSAQIMPDLIIESAKKNMLIDSQLGIHINEHYEVGKLK